MKKIRFWVTFISHYIAEIGTYLCGCTLEDVYGDNKTPLQRTLEEIGND